MLICELWEETYADTGEQCKLHKNTQNTLSAKTLSSLSLGFEPETFLLTRRQHGYPPIRSLIPSAT